MLRKIPKFKLQNHNIPDSDIRKRKLDNAEKERKKLMLLSCGRGEEFYEFPGQRREQNFQFWKT
jgi:hypothetical protein